MRTSDQINELTAALSKAQGEMSAAIKDSTNPHLKSKYADLTSNWDACRQPLSNHGLSVIQMPEHGEDGRMGLTTRLCHSSGQWIEGYLSISPTKMDIQGHGAALTYLRRYSLSAVLGIAPDDKSDDDGESIKGKPIDPVASKKPVSPPVMPTKGELAHYHELYSKVSEEIKSNANNFIKTFGDSVDKVPAYDLGRLKKSMMNSLPKEPAIEEEVPF